MSKKIITVDCDYNDIIPVEALFSIQENLKKPADLPRLKQSIIKNHIKFPLFVWHDKDMYKIIDGHHRVIACKELIEEGYKIAPGMPVVYISCKDHAEAKEHVLRGAARYAKVTKDKFSSFAEEAGLDLSDLYEELSRKTYGFLSDLIEDPFSLEEISDNKPMISGKSQGVSGDDLDFTLYQILFDDNESVARFWRLMSRLRGTIYKREDYKDILYKVLEIEVRKKS